MFPLISRLQALEKKDVVILQVHFFVWKTSSFSKHKNFLMLRLDGLQVCLIFSDSRMSQKWKVVQDWWDR